VRLNLGVLVVIALVGALSASCFGGSSSHSAAVSPTPPRVQLVVACDQVILQPKLPFADGYRRVLGVISAPPAYIAQVVRNSPGGRWPYWEKAGLVVRAGRSPVTVSVPQAWRTRAAITWGNAKPAVNSLRISACPSPPNVWNAYAGGFFMRAHGACIPLIFQVGHRRKLVRFGIDRRCA
jgi:hypothetical protein